MYAAPPSDFYDKDGNLVKHVNDGSTAQYKQVGKGLNLHYEFIGFDKSQSAIPSVAKNTVNLTTAIEEQQSLNLSNSTLDPVVGTNGTTTYCNFATQNILNTIASATDNSSGIAMTGMANSMSDQFATSPLLQSADKGTALANAENGGLSLLGYKNPGGHGHVASLSVGDNVGKGEVANVGRSNGFLPIGPEKGSVFGRKSIESVKFYTLRPTVTPKTAEPPRPPIIGTFKIY
ncbi:hypothetical protein, partial [Pedobacter sp. ASV12]|uniref:hypothetical protein n=1 Tax=Pedobacter sp. ASV12 TaxID=2795120 RepID=UPI0018EC47AF